MPLSYRYYLADAVFVAAVEGDDDLIDGLDEAVRAPTFPLYLGRRACPPSADEISLGVRPNGIEDALRTHEWLARCWYRRKQGRTVHLELVLDADGTQGDTETTRDHPLSFDPVRREYGWREVYRPHPVEMDNPIGRESFDPFAALGGA